MVAPGPPERKEACCAAAGAVDRVAAQSRFSGRQSGRREPGAGEIGIARDAVARLVKLAEVVGRPLVAVSRGPSIPDGRPADVGGDAAAAVEHHRHVELRGGQTGVSRAPV